MFNVHAVSALSHSPCLPISLLSFATFCCQYFLTLCPEKNQKIFSNYSKGNKGQTMPCQDPTYLSMPWRGTWDREDPKKLYTTPNHDPWNIQPKTCALNMLQWCKEVTIGTIACKGLNTSASHLTPSSVQGKLTHTSKTFNIQHMFHTCILQYIFYKYVLYYYHNEYVFQSCSMFTPFPPCPMHLVFLSAYCLSQLSTASISWPSARRKKQIHPLLPGQQRAAHAMSGSYLSQHAMKGHLRPWRP